MKWTDKHGIERCNCDESHARIRELSERTALHEAAMREIAAGLMTEDSAAGHHNRYELCVARLCGIARDSITAVDREGEPHA